MLLSRGSSSATLTPQRREEGVRRRRRRGGCLRRGEAAAVLPRPPLFFISTGLTRRRRSRCLRGARTPPSPTAGCRITSATSSQTRKSFLLRPQTFFGIGALLAACVVTIAASTSTSRQAMRSLRFGQTKTSSPSAPSPTTSFSTRSLQPKAFQPPPALRRPYPRSRCLSHPTSRAGYRPAGHFRHPHHPGHPPCARLDRQPPRGKRLRRRRGLHRP
jgi:hypothetical protein